MGSYPGWAGARLEPDATPKGVGVRFYHLPANSGHRTLTDTLTGAIGVDCVSSAEQRVGLPRSIIAPDRGNSVTTLRT